MRATFQILLVLIYCGFVLPVSGQSASTQLSCARLYSTSAQVVRLLNDSLQPPLSDVEQEALARELIVASQFILTNDSSNRHLVRTLKAAMNSADSTLLKQEWQRRAGTYWSGDEQYAYIEHGIDFIETLAEDDHFLFGSRPRSIWSKSTRKFLGNLGLVIGLTLVIADELGERNPEHPFIHYNLNWVDMAEMARSDPEQFDMFLQLLPETDLAAMEGGVNRFLAALREAEADAGRGRAVKATSK